MSHKNTKKTNIFVSLNIEKNMSIKSMPLWKWILLLIASFFLALLMYGFSGFPLVYFKGWPLWVVNTLVSVLMIVLYGVFVRWFEGEKPKDLPLARCAGHTGWGLATGLGYFIVVVGIMMVFGLYKINGIHAEWSALADAFFWFLIVAVGEEIVFRGVLFRWIDERFGFWWAMIVSGLIFGLVHIMNDNATLWSGIAIALEAGLLLGAAYKWAGTLWFPIGIHWAWNFSQGNIFGFAVSGNAAGETLIQASIEGPEWLTGGAFGAEASVIATVIGLALTAVFCLLRFGKFGPQAHAGDGSVS